MSTNMQPLRQRLRAEEGLSNGFSDIDTVCKYRPRRLKTYGAHGLIQLGGDCCGGGSVESALHQLRQLRQGGAGGVVGAGGGQTGEEALAALAAAALGLRGGAALAESQQSGRGAAQAHAVDAVAQRGAPVVQQGTESGGEKAVALGARGAAAGLGGSADAQSTQLPYYKYDERDSELCRRAAMSTA